MRIQKIAILSLFCLCSMQLYGLDLTKVNLSYQYDLSAQVRLSHRVVSLENEVVVFFRVDSESLASRSFDFLLQQEYLSAKHDTLKTARLDTIAFTDNSGSFKLTLPSTDKPLLIISVSDVSKGAYYVFDVNIQSRSGFPSIYPVDAAGFPVLSPYVTTDNVQIKGTDQLHAYAYLDNFKSADPPMGMMKTISPNIEIDSSFYFNGSTSAFEDFKFYLVQEDTLAESALTLLKCPPYFPKLKTIERLVEPLTYITTASEINALTSTYSKKSFETFWINTYSTKFRAKSAIKAFYDAIERVNLLFTDYKQGWKTDRGMLYLVYGAPTKVRRDERSETWVYNDGLSFEFIRISTLFAPTMYSLKRNRKYENVWYNQIGEIRKGL